MLDCRTIRRSFFCILFESSSRRMLLRSDQFTSAEIISCSFLFPTLQRLFSISANSWKRRKTKTHLIWSNLHYSKVWIASNNLKLAYQSSAPIFSACSWYPITHVSSLYSASYRHSVVFLAHRCYTSCPPRLWWPVPPSIENKPRRCKFCKAGVDPVSLNLNQTRNIAYFHKTLCPSSSHCSCKLSGGSHLFSCTDHFHLYKWGVIAFPPACNCWWLSSQSRSTQDTSFSACLTCLYRFAPTLHLQL